MGWEYIQWRPQPARANVLVLKQILNLIPRRLINRHALETGVEANWMDWAKHRRRKAAAKMHLRLGLHSFLPSSFAIVDTASQHGNKRAREVCTSIAPGEIVVFDKGYAERSILYTRDVQGWDSFCFEPTAPLPGLQGVRLVFTTR